MPHISTRQRNLCHALIERENGVSAYSPPCGVAHIWQPYTKRPSGGVAYMSAPCGLRSPPRSPSHHFVRMPKHSCETSPYWAHRHSSRISKFLVRRPLRSRLISKAFIFTSSDGHLHSLGTICSRPATSALACAPRGCTFSASNEKFRPRTPRIWKNVKKSCRLSKKT